MSVTRRGQGLEKLSEKLTALSKRCAKVGIPSEGNAAVGNINLATLAMILERGTVDGRIPARPFLTQTLAENVQKYTALLADKIRSGASVDDAYQFVAVIAQGDVQQMMVDGGWVANAPSTIKRKGSSKPLIDTGYLRQSIRGVVTDD